MNVSVFWLNISNEYLTIIMHSALLSGTVLFILGEELIAKFKSKYYLIITGVRLIQLWGLSPFYLMKSCWLGGNCKLLFCACKKSNKKWFNEMKQKAEDELLKATKQSVMHDVSRSNNSKDRRVCHWKNQRDARNKMLLLMLLRNYQLLKRQRTSI